MSALNGREIHAQDSGIVFEPPSENRNQINPKRFSERQAKRILPILRHKAFSQPSAFHPENLLREA